MTDASSPPGPEPARPPRAGTDRRGKRTLLLLAALCTAPVLASYVAYYLFPREAQVNYGSLLPTAPASAIEGTKADGAPFRLADLRGRWILLAGDSGGCAAACERKLYATRQARTMQGRDQDRLVRAWLFTGDAMPAPEFLAQHPGLVVARVPAGALAALPGGERAIYLIDPLGNLVLRFPGDPDINGIAKDLSRLLRASRIG
jgi:cytochrome oxidase Cu insertion factor (SCO1/SenC/PrrC family)